MYFTDTAVVLLPWRKKGKKTGKAGEVNVVLYGHCGVILLPWRKKKVCGVLYGHCVVIPQLHKLE